MSSRVVWNLGRFVNGAVVVVEMVRSRLLGKSLGRKAAMSSRVVWSLGRFVIAVMLTGGIDDDVGARVVEVVGRVRDVAENGFLLYRRGTNL